MRRLNDFKFYELGLKLAPLGNVTDETAYKDVFFELWSARTAINDLLEMFPLPICRVAGEELVKKITEIVPEIWKEALTKEKDAVIGYRSYWLRKGKETFENVLSAELNSLDTYILTQQGIYNTADLVERAEMAFTEAVRMTISDEAKKDFRQGGRCLAFELPTASGFHTMRATEAVLRQYHRLVMSLPAATRSPEMSQCINELRKQKEDPKVLNILDSIRDLHRNPQMHPEAFLSMDEAVRLFDIAKSAINAMADRIATLTAAIPRPATPLAVAAVATTPVAATAAAPAGKTGP